jgi:glycosyltransferase involved in cell wall biosynthesis
MNILIDNFGIPFFLAHGGASTQICGTLRGVRSQGVSVEFAQWWDTEAKPDLIHCFGIPKPDYLKYAFEKGIPVVCTNLFTAACNRSHRRMDWQGRAWKLFDSIGKVPVVGRYFSKNELQSLQKCSLCIVGIEAESQVLQRTFGIPRDRIRIVPLALSDEYLKPPVSSTKEDYLITTGTITERKRSIELANLAHQMKVPICFVGKPYDTASPYWHAFRNLIDGRFVRHIPHTESVVAMQGLLQSAKGFVLYSDYENWCLSAHEAAACGLPMLLPSQPWSIERFGSDASYFTAGKRSSHGCELLTFYKNAENLPVPTLRHQSWNEIGMILVDLYKELVA